MGKARPLARLEHFERIEEETKQILDLIRELDDTHAVALRLGIPESRVRTRLREAGVSTVLLRIERTVAVYKELGSVVATAERLGVCRSTARSRLESGVVLGRSSARRGQIWPSRRPDLAWLSGWALSASEIS